MRSLWFTITLAIVTVIACATAGWNLMKGNLDVLFGAPPTERGQHLYSGFTRNDVKRIMLTGNGVNAQFVREGNIWTGVQPWKDRMDPRAAESIIAFTLGTTAEDAIPKEKLESHQLNLKDSSVNIRLEGDDGRPLAKYWLGGRTAWFGTDAQGEAVPTVFMRPRDKSRKQYIYAATGDIHPLFKDGFRRLRDHHPFLFNPLVTERIRIRGAEGELTLGRSAPNNPWRIVKPLDLPTEPEAVKKLLEGLFELRAYKVHDRDSVTLPSNGTSADSQQIAIKLFGQDQETVLEIYPPRADAGDRSFAVVSDRPQTVFELASKAETELVSLAQLPLSVNELRSATLARLNIAAIQGIVIESANGIPVTLTHAPKQAWLADIEGKTRPANERRLFDLLKAITESKVSAFVTDAATDFSPWGLDRPFLSVRFLARDSTAIEILFGRDKNGIAYATRAGSSSVAKIDEEIISRIAAQPYQWRDAKLWSLSGVNISGIDRTIAGKPTISLGYDFFNQAWTAKVNGADRTNDLDPNRANYLLKALEELEVNRWLPKGDAVAAGVLAHPQLTLSVLCRQKDDEGNFTGNTVQRLYIAPASNSTANQFYYGRLDSDTHPFIIDREALMKLVVDLFGDGS